MCKAQSVHAPGELSPQSVRYCPGPQGSQSSQNCKGSAHNVRLRQLKSTALSESGVAQVRKTHTRLLRTQEPTLSHNPVVLSKVLYVPSAQLGQEPRLLPPQLSLYAPVLHLEQPTHRVSQFPTMVLYMPAEQATQEPAWLPPHPTSCSPSGQVAQPTQPSMLPMSARVAHGEGGCERSLARLDERVSMWCVGAWVCGCIKTNGFVCAFLGPPGWWVLRRVRARLSVGVCCVTSHTARRPAP